MARPPVCTNFGGPWACVQVVPCSLSVGLQDAMFTEDATKSREAALAIAHEACKTGLLAEMVGNLSYLDFESRQVAAQLFGAMIRTGDNGEKPGLEFVLQHRSILSTLLDG